MDDNAVCCKYKGSFLGMEEKEGSNVFVKRYFRFNHKKGLLLYYLDDPQNLPTADAKLAGFFNLQFVSMVSDASKAKPTVPHCFSITIQGKKHFFQTSSEKEQLSWITLLKDTAKIRVTSDPSPTPHDPRVCGDDCHTPHCTSCDCSDSSGDESRSFVAAFHSQSKPVKVGHCVKQGGKRKNWKKRYFVLNQESLSYFSSSDEKYPLRSVDISRIQEVRASTGSHSHRENLFEIVTDTRTFYIQAESEQEMMEWIGCVNHCLQRKVTLYSPSEFNSVKRRHSLHSFSDTQTPHHTHSQTTNQKRSETTNQTHSQTTNQTCSQTTNQTRSQTLDQTLDQTHSQTLDQTRSQTLGQTRNQTLGQTPSQTLGQTPSQTLDQTRSQTTVHDHKTADARSASTKLS